MMKKRRGGGYLKSEAGRQREKVDTCLPIAYKLDIFAQSWPWAFSVVINCWYAWYMPRCFPNVWWMMKIRGGG